ncbi:glycosyltransferase family 39 protein [Candidatus Woesebacteria bacterium]|nr:glycosyltransferase family 39 protein [Candidatus Woesebacteria bacterium]MBP9687170.1 glycosyltransferase family 39 protein [Candidatus Woesebacteria bacterium]
MKKILSSFFKDTRLAIALCISAFILIASTVVRLFHLTILPVFADEAIYVRWAQVMKAEPTLRYLPLSDGKEPLYMWILMPVFKIFSNPLFAGRFVSVAAGMGTSLGVMALAYVLFRSKKVAVLSLFLYLVSPFTFFFHRMALVDSLLSFFGVWVAVFSVLTVKNIQRGGRSLDFPLATGFSLGFAWLTKSPALFFALLSSGSVIFIRKPSIKVIVLSLFAILFSIVIGYGMYNTLRLGPNFQMIASRNLDYVFPVSHIIENPRDPFIFHVDRALEWFFILGPFTILILAALSSIDLVKKYSREVLFLLAWFAIPLLVEAEFAKVFTARYVFFTIPPLAVLAGAIALSQSTLIRRVSGVIIFAGVVLSVQNIFLLITNPARAYLPNGERSGYLVEWTAGTGIYESSLFVRQELKAHPDQQIVIATEGYFGTLPDGLQIYLEKVPNVTIFGTGLNFSDVPQSLKDAKKEGKRVFFAVNASRLNLKKSPEEYGLKTVLSFPKELRDRDTREYVQLGDRDTYYFFELQ